MSEALLITMFARSRGFQYILIAIAIILIIHFLRREIIDTKCAIKDGAETLSKSEMAKFAGNALKTGNLLMEGINGSRRPYTDRDIEYLDELRRRQQKRLPAPVK